MKKSIELKMANIDIVMKAMSMTQWNIVEKSEMSIGTVNKTVKLMRSAKPSTKLTRFQISNMMAIAKVLGVDSRILIGKLTISLNCKGAGNDTGTDQRKN